jgi:hypothetical protein
MGFIGMSPLDVAACCGVVGVHRPSRGKSVAQRSSSSGAKTISRVSNYGSGCWRGWVSQHFYYRVGITT